MDYVIIGNGVAGTTAAASIRETDPEGNITIYTDEAYPYYSRIRLIEYLSGEVDENALTIRKDEWYKDLNILLKLEHKVEEVDADKKELKLASGDKVSYDKLLLATGGYPFKPPIKGADKKGVFTLRSMRDAQAIREMIKDGGRHVVVIGGGVLGLEVGNSILKTGCSVTIVEFFDRLLPRQMDTEGASILQAQLESFGLRFFLGAQSEEIIGDGEVEKLLLKDGTEIDCDLIIISAGIRPTADLPRQLDLTVDRGVVVNDKLETEKPDIYAAGDLIQHNGISYGIWPASEKQGQIAGKNMAGEETLYNGTTISNRLKVAGIDLFCAGNIDCDGVCESIVLEDHENYTYKKLVLKNNTIGGAILYGDIKNLRKIVTAIEGKKDISDIKEDLLQWNLEKL